METDESDRYRAPALDKGLDILELLAGVDSGLTQAEIAKRLDRSPTNSTACSIAWYAAVTSPGWMATATR